MQEMRVWSRGREDLLGKEMATHSSILAWEMLWTGESGGLQSMGLQELYMTYLLHHHHPPSFAGSTWDGESIHWASFGGHYWALHLWWPVHALLATLSLSSCDSSIQLESKKTSLLYYIHLFPYNWFFFPIKIRHVLKKTTRKVFKNWNHRNKVTEIETTLYHSCCPVTQLCLTCCGPPFPSVHGILQARILEWVAISFSRDQTHMSYIGSWVLYHWATREVHTIPYCSCKKEKTSLF